MKRIKKSIISHRVKRTLFLSRIISETFSYLADTESFKSYNNLLNEYKVHLSANEGLAKFWLSFLNMVELLLNIIYACRAGKWELYFWNV